MLFTSCSGREANSVIKSDTSTASSNQIRVSDSSASSGSSTKGEAVTTATVVATEVGPPEESDDTKNHSDLKETASADYDEIEEDKSEQKLKGDTLQSAADSTLSTVNSFNSSMRDSGMRDSTLLYDGGQESFLDNLEPGAHNTPRFPTSAANYNNLAVNRDYEKDPNYSYAHDHDYEQDPDYQKQQKKFDPPLPPTHLYQALQQHPSQLKENHYKAPEKTLRPISEKLPRVAEHVQPEYDDTVPHSNTLSTHTPQAQNYTELRQSTLEPLAQYTRLDMATKERTRGNGLSYTTTDL